MENEFVINKNEILEASKSRGESAFLTEKRTEALDKLNSLDMIKPDKTRVSKWDFFTVTDQFVESDVFGSLEELPEAVREVIDIETVENVIIQHNNTTAFTKVSDDLKSQGVIVESIFDAAHNHPELLEKYFMTDAVKIDENKLTAYHAALLNGGVFIYVPKNVQVKSPIQMVVLHDDEKASLFNHVIVVADTGAEVTYVENYVTTLESAQGKLNIVSEVIANDNARIKYGAVDFLAKEVVGYVVRRGVTGNDAVIDWALGLMNDSDVIYDNTTYLMGHGSSSDVKIVHVGRGNQKSNFTTEVIHYGKETTGNILKHGVMKDSASSVFNGIGYIKHGATNADAQQESRVLMLSPNARGDANPILLIDEDEVVAGHAASAGQVDEIQLFYLMSRGLKREEAERLVIHGFLAPVVESIPIESVKNLLVSVIEEKIVN
ncbi:Fe-S cluster assembly protein SufD [Phocicoccus pinnipedialis]|uniref:FeS cluster assembly protein SufB n=1 Tax=Phocicoccus pinnipedialis TaxID=110845 RepID=A0A6V7R8P6_9BACL|nr:Fe-S cluster assembly protein SufD [Jeotgalicoccus pinnipedialis]MBP1938855.1 Fe-S cluster assembly protein SufD [Jeotgalicoccus pinnipedialis]CAD2073305.1 FeS cluster assembly protein SufB [Jeotgalicoccus pinnipedialis]